MCGRRMRGVVTVSGVAFCFASHSPRRLRCFCFEYSRLHNSCYSKFLSLLTLAPASVHLVLLVTLAWLVDVGGCDSINQTTNQSISVLFAMPIGWT